MALLSVRARALLAPAALALFSIACGDKGTETLTPSAVEAAVATSQTDTVGKPVAVTPAVVVKATNGKPVPGVSVNFAVTSGSGASVASTTTTTGSDGVATAGSWTLGPAVGSYQVTATVPVLTTANTVSFSATAVPDAPAQIVFLSQPGATGVGTPVSALQVQLQDKFGNAVTNSGVTVTISLGANPGSATLGGTLSQTTVNGVATFTNITLSAPGTGFTLVASSPGLQSATTTTFVVTATRIFGQLTLTNNLVLAAGGGGTSGSRVARGEGGSATFRARRPGGVAAPIPDGTAARAGTRTQPVKRASPLRLGGGRGGSRPYVPDELIVVLKPGATSGGSASAMTASGAAAAARGMRQRLAALAESAGDFQTAGVSPVLRAAKIKVNPRDVDAVAARLRRDPGVESVTRNALMWASEGSTARASGGDDSRRTGVPTNAPSGRLAPFQAWHYNLIDLPRAWAITTGSANVIVAVIDDGIRFDHPALRNATQDNLLNDGYDFVSSDKYPVCGSTTDSVNVAGDGNGYDPDPTLPKLYNFNDDLNCVPADSLVAYGGHGLHVAGTIAAQRSSNGSTGVSPLVKIRPIRALSSIGGGSNYDIAQAVLWAVCLPATDPTTNQTIAPAPTCQPARIINMSLSGPFDSPVLHSAIIQATTRGALVVAAAGNSQSSALHYPAAWPEVLSVAAVGPERTQAAYSTFNSGVDITAPGGDFEREPRFNDGTINGDFGIFSLTYAFQPFSAGSQTIPANTPLYNLAENGTSMAAPHVAGVAALLLAREPGLTVQQLRDRLVNFAIDLGTPGRDDIYGAGLVNAYNSLTQTTGPALALFARLYNHETGAIVSTVPVLADNSYVFPAVGNGTYRVYAGQDEAADASVGEPGRRWSAFGGTGKPSVVTINGVEQSASFTVGLPGEMESNNTTTDADELALGGYIQGNHALAETDMLRVRIPTAGTYTFTTSATVGACGFALDEDTILTLYQSNGTTVIATSDDIDATNNSYCSRITQSLAAGTYFLAVTGKTGVLPAGGRYRVQVK